MKYGLIYMHKNKINNKKYIGQTTQRPEYRWNHGEGYKESSYFYAAIQKYGWDNFEHIILEENIPEKYLDKREEYWINYYKTFEEQNGYNLTTGGTEKLNDEQKKRRKDKLKKWRDNNPEIVKKTINAMQQYWLNNPEEKEKALKKASKNSAAYWKNHPKEKQIVLEKMINNARAVTSIQVKCIETGECYFSVREAAKQTGVINTSISKACLGKQKTAGGYHWKYISMEEYNICKLEKEMDE